MALTFGALTSDRVQITAAASINDLDPITFLVWCFPTTLTSARAFGWKGATTSRKRLILNGTGGNVEMFVNRNTTNADYITNNTPLSSTSVWHFLAASFASASTPSIHIYHGTLTAAAAECTYGTATNGSGTVTTEAGDFVWGNGTTNTNAIQGSIAYAAYVNKEMSLAEVIRWQFQPRMTAETKIFTALGFAGTGAQPDWSGNGNAGMVTGATQSDHVPLGPLFGFDTEWQGAISAAAPSAPVGRLVQISQAVKLGSTW